MRNIKYDPLIRLIHINTFDYCYASKLRKSDIIKKYPTRKDGAYYLDKFINHLKHDCKLSIVEYCEKYFDFAWPQCPIKKDLVGYRVNGKGLTLSKFNKGAMSREHCPSFDKACRKMSRERCGEGNPMYGKTAWNKGLNTNDPRIEKIAAGRRGKETPQHVKEKQSISAKNRKIHGHTGKKHSSSTIEKLRENTAKLWASGVFNRATSIHIKVREYLQELGLSFEEEHQVKYFSLDFALIQDKVGIECQGTFFHVDPRIYPNGPICAIQRRNFGRDKAKRKICCDREGWVIIELWETEINDGTFKEYLKCELQKLNLLKK